MSRSVLSLALLGTFSFCGVLPGDESGKKSAPADLTTKLSAAAKKLANEQTYDLHYKVSPHEAVRWKIVQLQTVETKIRGSETIAKMRSVSQKLWTVSDVDADGNITFMHQVESVDMWQSVSGRQEVRYNSETDEIPPPEYAEVAKSVGMPLATITMNRHGRLVKRDKKQFNAPGIGEFAIPLPEEPVKAGASWQVPDEVKVPLDEARMQTIKTRQIYTLQKVEAGLATIDVRTEVLTPINDPKIESQIVQRMTRGTIKFDVDAGRLLSKQLDLDKTVIGFSGAESAMTFLARVTEDLLPAHEPATAKKSGRQKISTK